MTTPNATQVALDTLLGLLKENLTGAVDKLNERGIPTGQSLIRTGRVNGLEEAILITERFAALLRSVSGEDCPRCGGSGWQGEDPDVDEPCTLCGSRL